MAQCSGCNLFGYLKRCDHEEKQYLLLQGFYWLLREWLRRTRGISGFMKEELEDFDKFMDDADKDFINFIIREP